MGNLLLDSLEVRGFRGFRDLKIERLGRVNLIVGKNSVGKSSLLEALQLYADRGFPGLLWELLETRNEVGGTLVSDSSVDDESIQALKYLFHGRRGIRETIAPIQIGPLGSQSEQVSVTVEGSKELINEGNGRIEKRLPSLSIKLNDVQNVEYALDAKVSYRLWRNDRDFDRIPYTFIRASGLTEREIGRLWDKTVLTAQEADVIKALRIITPDVERMNLINVEKRIGDSSVVERIPIAKIAGLNDPVPFLSMGEGASRIFEIALALVNSKDGILLVDEIDSGLHYSVQLNLWRLIFEVARRLNVQVFATTHSWDCIEAFQTAAVEDQQEEGVLIRLEEKQGEIVATLFNEHELTIVAREQIEVR